MLLQTRESSSEGAALSPPASTGGQEKSPAPRVPRGTDGAENNPRAQLLGVQAAAPASWGLSPTLPTWGVFVPSARPGHRAAVCTGVQWVHTHTPPCAPSELCSADVAMLVHLPGVVGSSRGAASTRRGSPPPACSCPSSSPSSPPARRLLPLVSMGTQQENMVSSKASAGPSSPNPGSELPHRGVCLGDPHTWPCPLYPLPTKVTGCSEPGRCWWPCAAGWGPRPLATGGDRYCTHHVIASRRSRILMPRPPLLWES